jgi:hypothetical protein
MLNFQLNMDIDQYISKNFIQTVYQNEQLSLQRESYSDIANTKVCLETYFLEQFNLIKNFKQYSEAKSIGIYSIFISDYSIFYDDFIRNIEDYFYPDITKHYYIVTDKNLIKHNDRTYFYNTEKIGWPYETLYRFKYFLLFNENDINKSEYIFFLNSNAKFLSPIFRGIMTNDYAFTKHNGYYYKSYQQIPFEKNTKSMACISYRKNILYEYYGGGFFGASKSKFIELSKLLNDNIDIDEKNNYIAIWHDESHLNKFINDLKINGNKNFTILDYRYHVPEQNSDKFKDIKIIYLDKNKILKNYNIIKTISTYGNIIKNKYNS